MHSVKGIQYVINLMHTHMGSHDHRFICTLPLHKSLYGLQMSLHGPAYEPECVRIAKLQSSLPPAPDGGDLLTTMTELLEELQDPGGLTYRGLLS